MTTGGINAEEIEYWNGEAGSRWASRADQLDGQLGPIGRTAQERAGIAAGQRVVDVGCGCGGSTLELAERVGPRGEVTGLDASAVMLDVARSRAADRGASQIALLQGDAQTHAFEPDAFDHAYSRFGVMFFADPVDALANVRRALVPGGRLTFACWDRAARNPWISEALEVAARHVEIDRADDDGGPGPFAFAERERVERILGDAGYDEVAISPSTGRLLVGGPGDLDSAVEFAMEIGPAAAALRDSPVSLRRKAAGEMREMFSRHRVEDGVSMDYAAWIVSARR